jgi:hypothetical protein
LKSIGSSFSSYTYSDITSGFFDDAVKMFRNHSQKMNYQTLDIENNPEMQGFEPNSYDVCVLAFGIIII